jgi:hypothetical protein
MGMTIWVNYLKNGKVSSDESDKSALYRHLDKLDKLCAKLRVRKLSDFLDTTDLEANASGDPAVGSNTWELMAKRGKWFDPDEGLSVLSALIELMRAEPVRFGLLSDNYPQVLADLTECRASVERAKNDGAQFHLCVVS